jgi:hypothetical protein
MYPWPGIELAVTFQLKRTRGPSPYHSTSSKKSVEQVTRTATNTPEKGNDIRLILDPRTPNRQIQSSFQNQQRQLNTQNQSRTKIHLTDHVPSILDPRATDEPRTPHRS